METTKTLVLVFLDEDGNEKTIIIKDPKDNVTLAEAVAVMEAIIEDGVIQTSSGKSLDAVSTVYYKEVTVTTLTNPEGGE